VVQGEGREIGKNQLNKEKKKRQTKLKNKTEGRKKGIINHTESPRLHFHASVLVNVNLSQFDTQVQSHSFCIFW
jgi:hypothetical protein